MILTSDYTVSLVTYGQTPQRALMDAVIEIDDALDEYDLTPSEMTIHVHKAPVTNPDGYMTYTATVHLVEIRAN
ncbi:MAG TPA: hypothetical protein VIG24_19035 [Acidimicrobiia bacterium]